MGPLYVCCNNVVSDGCFKKNWLQESPAIIISKVDFQGEPTSSISVCNNDEIILVLFVLVQLLASCARKFWPPASIW